MPPLSDTTYVLPIRRTAVLAADDLPAYLGALARLLPVIVADGSPADVFAHHAAAWPRGVRHIGVDEDRRGDLNGKVAGVVSALRRVRTSNAVIADDDVRYDAFTLARIIRALDDADIVRPQNVFVPLPWHALLDSGRSLVARATGGDWPGTFALRMETYRRAGAYDGDVLFENLELVRTLRAVGGRERNAPEIVVQRRPPSLRHYAAQRVRQAYDEFARPAHLLAQLSLLPAFVVSTKRFGPLSGSAWACAAMALAEAGRRRAGGTRSFGPAASVCAPIWVAERAVTAWLALGLRVARGGVRYSNGTLRTAAHGERALRARHRRVVA